MFQIRTGGFTVLQTVALDQLSQHSIEILEIDLTGNLTDFLEGCQIIARKY